MNAKERLLQFIDYKGIKKAEFYKKTQLSNGFLDKNANISSDKIEIISSVYEDLDLYWLITGTGNMLRMTEETEVASTIIYRENPDKNEIIGLQRSKIELLEEKIDELKKN